MRKVKATLAVFTALLVVFLVCLLCRSSWRVVQLERELADKEDFCQSKLLLLEIQIERLHQRVWQVKIQNTLSGLQIDYMSAFADERTKQQERRLEGIYRHMCRLCEKLPPDQVPDRVAKFIEDPPAFQARGEEISLTK